MKKLLIAIFALAFTGLLQAQQKQGRIIYEHRIALPGEIDGRSVPIKFSPGNLEVLFANGQSLLKQLPVLDEVNENEGIRVSIVSPVSNQVTFTNLETGKYVFSQELEQKKYLIADTINKLSWTLTGETKTILGHKCQQATARRISLLGQSYGISGEEGVEENVVVWFAPSIPVAAGPDLQGQLPGLILEINIDNGKIIYKALELSADVELAEIKEPVVGTKVTAKEFAKMSEEILKQME